MLRVAILTLVMCSGCTFSPGNPHGEVTISHIDVALDVEDRLEQGTQDRLRVGNDYVLELKEFNVTLGELVVEASADLSVANTSFDPSSPPPGYSLCHNGHCHADDGRLVPYEEIARELAQGSGGAGAERVLQEIDEEVAMSPTLLDVRVEGLTQEGCTNACEFTTPGTPSAAILAILEVKVRATIFDVSDRQRLPEDGMPLNITLTPDTPFELFGALTPDADEAGPAHDISGTLTILPTIFDGIDWPMASDQPDLFMNALLDVERYAWTPQLSTKELP